MKDIVGNELSIGDLVVYGKKARNQGTRGEIEIGTITDIDNRYVTVDSSYNRLTWSSVRKCSPKFAAMFKDGTIYDI